MQQQVLRLSYVPHDPATGSLQQAFHEGRYEYRYRWALAGTGGGKTHAAAYEALCWMLENPPGVGLFAAPDYKMLGRILIPALEAHLGSSISNSPLTRSYNKVEHRWELVNGWVVWFMGLEDPEKAEGPNVDLEWVTEARLVRKWGGEKGAWMTLQRRLRGSRPGNRMGCIIETHSPTEEQEQLAQRQQGEGIGKIYRWSTMAARRAGTLPAAYEEVIRSYSGKAAERVLEGKYALAEGLVYDQFDPDCHLRAWPRRPDGRPAPPDAMSYGVDWGWTQPCAVVAVAWKGETSHVVGEVYGSHMGVADVKAALEQFQSTWGEGQVWCGHDKPEHVADLQAAGFAAESFVGKVADGCDLINDKLRGGTHFIDGEACPNVVREKKAYGRKPGTGEPEKGDDHSQDAERYGTVGGPGEAIGAW